MNYFSTNHYPSPNYFGYIMMYNLFVKSNEYTILFTS